MKPDRYSIYETKTRLSEILRRVRGGRRVVITHGGVAVAEIVPFDEAHEGLEQRLERLEREGIIHPPHGGPEEMACVIRKPGALARFLDERED